MLFAGHGGILSDLFPGMDLPEADYTQLDAGLKYV